MRIHPILPGLLLLASCADPATDPDTHNAKQPTEQFGELISGLLGDWQDASDDGTVFEEHWERMSDTRYDGRGLVLSGFDTVFVEYLSIRTDSSGTIYSARIPSQNDGGRIDFKLISAIGDSMVFENPEHDFPKRISYTRTAQSDWNVRVSGDGMGGMRTEHLHFIRPGSTPN